MKIEPLGCFENYLSPPIEETTDNGTCTTSTCPGIKISGTGKECPCELPQYWNGDECVARLECPCVKDGDIHKVGDNYHNENCEKCTCTMNGFESCEPKKCPECGAGSYRVEPGTCSCECKKCSQGTKSCPSSEECVLVNDWCNGVKDCPDDETDCPKPEPPPSKEDAPPKECHPVLECNEGYERKLIDPSDVEVFDYMNSKSSNNFKTVESTFKKPNQSLIVEPCLKYECVTSKNIIEVSPCPLTRCPEGQIKKILTPPTDEKCAKFACVDIPIKNATCSIDGQSITTFDETEFKYEICDHLLARDVLDTKWNIRLKKNCAGGNIACTKQVTIVDNVAKYTLVLLQDMTVNLNDNSYTMDQLGDQDSFIVKLSKVGDTLLYSSKLHGVWVTLNRLGNVKLSTSAQNIHQIDGLCGYYNQDKTDDKRMPDGTQSISTQDFGDSWSMNKNELVNCVHQTCPKIHEEKAWEMCNLAKSAAFKACGNVMDLDKFINQCFEGACTCLSTDSIAAQTPEEIEEECKCATLGNLATECMAKSSMIQLDSWRAIHECEFESCVAPFEHKDCYRHECESTCNTIDKCPPIEGSCFSGCFCPEGMVKKGDGCVKPSKCRNCVCDGFGQSQYLTYDRSNFTFDGNCTYLMSRDISTEKVHSFQVYATVGPCEGGEADSDEKVATCTQAIYLLHGSKKILVQRASKTVLDVSIDGTKIKFPYILNGIEIKEETTELHIFLTKSQIELNIMFEKMAFSIKVPKLKYGDKMEGLCGNCNADIEDDLQENPKQPSNSSTTKLTQKQKIDNFVWSWLADEPKLQLTEKSCFIDRKPPCLLLPEETDPCMKILNDPVFGKCHLVVSPFSYLDACQKYICRAGPVLENVCEPIAAYVRECARNNICIDWRRNDFCEMNCESPFEYTPCGCSKTCDTFETSLKLNASSSAANTCAGKTNEGCFCPSGKVQRDNKCILEKECKKCDETHFLGDVWNTDACTECKCLSDGKISCSSDTCSHTVCKIGEEKVEISSGTNGCCKKFVCMPSTVQGCNATMLLVCAENQMDKIIDVTEKCKKHVCECIPKEDCPPIKNTTSLEIGMTAEVDPTGCCDFMKVKCDKSKCPLKPVKCSEEYYEVEITRSINITKCCDIYECRPPPNKCIAKINGEVYLKKISDTWISSDPCVSEMCERDDAGKPVIRSQKKTCDVICKPGEELMKSSKECCGKCIKTQCVVDNNIYNVGETWQNPGDNCTIYKCENLNKEISTSTSRETCPDISKCPQKYLVKGGCCQRCELPEDNLLQCDTVSMAKSFTVGLVTETLPVRGICKNIIEIEGLTECQGVCDSKTKYNPATFGQTNDCGCCTATATTEITVDLVCQDKSKIKKNISVPLKCACSKDGCSESNGFAFSPILNVQASQ